jgi:hypothetical protein
MVPTARHGVGDIADIAVALGLYPGPALNVLKDEDVVAEQKLGVDAGIRARSLADIGHGSDDTRRPPGDEAIGGDLASQPGIGEIGTEGVEAGIPDGQIGNSFK